MSKQDWENLNNEIISCKKCKRLVAFRKKIAKEKMVDLNAFDLKGAVNIVKGSAVSMGMEVIT